MKYGLILIVAAFLAGCGGSGGDAVTATATPNTGDCSVTGTFVNSGDGDIVIMQTCVDGNGNSSSSCKNEHTQEAVDCSGVGGNTVNPTATPAS